jgi:hypothetical protein
MEPISGRQLAKGQVERVCRADAIGFAAIWGPSSAHQARDQIITRLPQWLFCKQIDAATNARRACARENPVTSGSFRRKFFRHFVRQSGPFGHYFIEERCTV